MSLLFIGLLILFLFLSLNPFKVASNDLNWQSPHKILPEVDLKGDVFTIANLRDFQYRDKATVTEENYLTEAYKISELKQVWYGISHFGKNGLAHVLLSFEFADDRYLVVSIEARQEIGKSYRPFKGLFRGYTKIVVLGTERDIIGLRSYHRKESFFLYPLTIPELNQTALLLSFLRRAQHLNWQPEFYHTVLDNCLTGLLAESRLFPSWTSWFDKRILLPGKSDQLAYELKLLNNQLDFDEMQMSARINQEISPEQEDFSEMIRGKQNN